jgi:tetratricopeptide (TPR) repeat protein
MLDATFFGLRPGGYHFINVLLHTLGVLLLFLLLRQMTGAVWRSAFVAALFAIHPLRAESVAWISERKDVLSGVFFFLSLMAYVRYVRKGRSRGAYLLLSFCFALGLLAKAMLVTLPFLLLLLDFWPLRRFALARQTSDDATTPAASSVSRLVREKLPLLALVIAVSIATVFAQERALVSASAWPMPWRVENALVTIWIYLRQMVWPVHLAVFYPHPKGTLPIWSVAAALFFFLLVSAGAFFGRKKYPYLFTGWFWYIGMLVPVVGLVQVGLQAHADRYTYLPQIGIYILIAWGAADLSADWRACRLVLGGLTTAIILGLMLVAYRQVGYWAEPVRLWSHALLVTKNNNVAERGIGTALLRVGRLDEAIAHDRAAVRLEPHEPLGLTNLANALFQKGELPEAINHFREVVRLRPNDSEVRRNLGKALAKNGAPAEALEQFRAALRIQPNDSDAAYSAGNLLLEQGRIEEAISFFQQAIAADPRRVDAHYNLAIALNRAGRAEKAIAEFHETLRLQPQHVDAHNNLAITLLRQGQVAAAISEWQKALQIQPNNADIHNNLAVAFLRAGQLTAAVAEWHETLRLQPGKIGTQLSLAWMLATAPEAAVRNGPDALQLAERAYQTIGARNLMSFRVLAAACAEVGKFSDAMQLAREGAQRAAAQGQAALAHSLEGDLSLYEERAPLRDPTHGIGAGRTAAP